MAGLALTEVAHRLNVRKLYKAVLRLHRGLPTELKILGDKYVREEFRRHKTADRNSDYVRGFMIEWTDYAITLAKQLSTRAMTAQSRQSQSVEDEHGIEEESSEQANGQPALIRVGRDLGEEKLSVFSQEQLLQLYALKQETEKPPPLPASSTAAR
ncbi:hypothetical protein RvY_18130 [Ramazzottius varieornatus]|uniref:Succinate dehydrogenase assembly factor 3 n=1 Tax=Ramazzottius varieornatus TaxID=947166 RepID=A0A1D1W9X8_RAMVA|nr:hypothetical protein RvY_18130 [Ramazzottius varieornatus]